MRKLIVWIIDGGDTGTLSAGQLCAATQESACDKNGVRLVIQWEWVIANAIKTEFDDKKKKVKITFKTVNIALYEL